MGYGYGRSVGLILQRVCNRHSDCDKAEREWLKAHPNSKWCPVNFHCHDDECEDCFGC
jgi:hypothetical protein